MFKGLGLKIVKNSFIRINSSLVSQEYDIMVIEGEGNPIPYADGQVEVELEKVLAIIQVKKTLNPQQLEEGYLNLRNVFDIADFEIMPGYQLAMFADCYQSIAKESITLNNKLRDVFKSVTHEAVFHTLRWEAFLPIRILFSYDGYKTEQGIRDAFFNFLVPNRSSTSSKIKGFSPLHFPNLIINSNFSIIKNNGLPYVSPIIENRWPFYTSTEGNPMLQLIELIWTRISYKHKLDPSIFGEDLILEGANLFITGNLVNSDGMRGWNFDYKNTSRKSLQVNDGNLEWQPVKLTMAQHHIITYLCKNWKIRINRINQCLETIGEIVEEENFIEQFLDTNLVYVKDNKDLVLATQKCQTIITKDGLFAADNKTGRLTRWVIKNYPGFINN